MVEEKGNTVKDTRPHKPVLLTIYLNGDNLRLFLSKMNAPTMLVCQQCFATGPIQSQAG